jgi:O-antigen/teichoic acid export membrane protein
MDATIAPLSYGQIVSNFYTYCKPLIFVTVGLFIYDFLDKWMLQRFAGAKQQGFFQIANQFSAISLLVTSSILNVFWKEIASANEEGNHEKVKYLYLRVTRGLVFISAAVSGFLIPWSENIVFSFLGEKYLAAFPILSVMLLYPVHQGIGQVTGTMFLASGQTPKYMKLALFNMALSIPVSYLLLAPPDAFGIPGLGLGAFGMSVKMVVLQIFGVNLAAWIIAKWKKWPFEWLYQLISIIGLCAVGYGVYWVTTFLMKGVAVALPLKVELGLSMLFGAILFFSSVAVIAILFPETAGMNKEEIKNMKNIIIRKKI